LAFRTAALEQKAPSLEQKAATLEQKAAILQLKTSVVGSEDLFNAKTLVMQRRRDFFDNF